MSEGTLQSRDDGEFDLDLFFFGAEPSAVQSDMVSMLDRGAETCSGALQPSVRGGATANVLSDTSCLSSSQNGLLPPHFMSQGIQQSDGDLASCCSRESSWGMCSTSTLQITLSRTSPDKVIQADRSPSDISSIIAHLRSLASEAIDNSTRPDLEKSDSYEQAKPDNERTDDHIPNTASGSSNCLEKQLDFQDILGTETSGGQYSFINVESNVNGKSSSKSYICSYCGKSCPCRSAFIRHQRIHTGEKPYHCTECSKSFIQSSDYNNHMRSHTGEKPYSCAECGKNFSRSTYLVTHSRTHTKEKPYLCTVCGKSFIQHSHLSLHLRIHSGEKPYICIECGNCFSRSSTLLKHKKSHRRKTFQVYKKRNKETDQSTYINEKALSWEALVEGNEESSLDPPQIEVKMENDETLGYLQQTKSCQKSHKSDKKISRKSSRNALEKYPVHDESSGENLGPLSHHRKRNVQPVDNKKIEILCMEDAQTSSPSTENATNPVKMEDNPQSQNADFCTKSENSKDSKTNPDCMNAAMTADPLLPGAGDNGKPCERAPPGSQDISWSRTQNSQEKSSSYICSYCGKGCPCKSAFLRHQRIHTGEKPYSCSECGKSFIQSSDYNNHLRSHTGEKPYSCQECGKGFSRSTYLMTHSRIHTKEKPYTCADCGKSFIQHSHLAIHSRIHSGEKPYTCFECGKPFSRSSTLAKHQKSHSKKKVQPLFAANSSALLPATSPTPLSITQESSEGP
uniref:C2H2-type domain-containing protein n=1 Tax=Leptobrachium leishanense TaxID=445787 RepID=A0A8C5QIK1_9ANUR